MEDRCQMRWRGPQHVLVLLGFLICADVPTVVAQTETTAVKPYASMDAEKVDYRGPGRDKINNIQNGVVHIGLLLPMQGRRAPEGKLLLQAAQIAIDEENKSRPLTNGQRFELAVEDESGPWGQASSAMVRLIMQDEAVALITATDGNIAHQAEQLANKVGIPVVTLASDPTTTKINIPWIFRVGSSDTEQVRAIARDVYGVRGLHKVLLITESGHDGRIGGEEFMKAAASLAENPPERFEINTENFSLVAMDQGTHATQVEAVVLWTSSTLAHQLLPSVRETIPSALIYVCQKAADFFPGAGVEVAKHHDRMVFTVGTGIEGEEFARQYRDLTGAQPGMAAQQMNEAVGTIAEGVRHAGNNRARVRDRLAARGGSGSTSGVVSFDAAGNERGEARLVSIEAGVGAAVAP